MSTEPVAVTIEYNPDSHTANISVDDTSSSIWARIKLAIRTKKLEHNIIGGAISLSWPDGLTIVRELGTRANQKLLNFRFKPGASAAQKLKEFAVQLKRVREQRLNVSNPLSSEEIVETLQSRGFTRRQLKPFQLRDLAHLAALANGANFSVPGAGKTTVTFALHVLTRQNHNHLFIVAPKAAVQAWVDIVDDCMEEGASDRGSEPFTILNGSEEDTRKSLESGATRFIMSYDLMIRQQSTISTHFAMHPPHLVLDESHRMKAGWRSQRGAFLLNISDLAIRRDILSGTPMPQSASDLESQLDFLWPGHGLGLEIIQGRAPRDVLGKLYVRTTKTELGLPKAERHFIDVEMSSGQLALYSMIRNEFVRNYSTGLSRGISGAEFSKARRSVMRLLQLSVNPSLAISAMESDGSPIESSIVDQVLDEGNSAKLRAVADHARLLAGEGKKAVIWTIFTGTIHSLAASLADLNPVVIHGGVPSGSANDSESREGRIKRFHEDNSCFVLIANPAAAGEGISLHTVCHNALYADRSYVSTHYLQSIDRIHRLGLPSDTETNIFIYRSKAPPVIGSIDYSVSRRLVEKIGNMQALLDDPDLHEIAFDEEEADDPIDYDVELKDIMDLIAELEGKAEDCGSEDL